jgi:uncharacterized membrane protein YjfL (UPF0719 family)
VAEGEAVRRTVVMTFAPKFDVGGLHHRMALRGDHPDSAESAAVIIKGHDRLPQRRKIFSFGGGCLQRTRNRDSRTCLMMSTRKQRPAALVCICGLVVFLRISSYASWSTARRPGRFALAMRDGLLAGLVVGMVTLITPNSGESSIAPPPFASVLTWFVVLMAVGCLNALLLYGLASTITNFQHAIPVNTHDVQNRQIELL